MEHYTEDTGQRQSKQQQKAQHSKLKGCTKSNAQYKINKTRVRTRVLAKGKQLLFLIRHKARERTQVLAKGK